MKNAREYKNQRERDEALGSFLNPRQGRFFSNIEQFWNTMKQPGPGEWLSTNPEPGQTYTKFVQNAAFVPTKQKNCIYIVPLDDIITSEMWEYFLKLCSAFFMGVKVEFLPWINLQGSRIPNRENTYGVQYNATEIIRDLTQKLPKNGFCLVGITMYDIFPSEEYNFVYGLAWADKRWGVFSFCRHLPSNISNAVENTNLLFNRAGKTLTHEIGHLFGMRHCIYYECLMSGNNGGDEAYKYPSQLCPICLRKLQHWLKFDIVERYTVLAQASSRPSDCYVKDRQWYEERIAAISYQPKNNEERKVATKAPNRKK